MVCTILYGSFHYSASFTITKFNVYSFIIADDWKVVEKNSRAYEDRLFGVLFSLLMKLVLVEL